MPISATVRLPIVYIMDMTALNFPAVIHAETQPIMEANGADVVGRSIFAMIRYAEKISRLPALAADARMHRQELLVNLVPQA
ncbi:MAG: hypothetical protein V1766_02210 [Pseudomonadota bacterium]